MGTLVEAPCDERLSGLRCALGRLVRQPCLAGLALLGGSELSRILALDDLDRTAGLLDRLAGALRRTGDLQRQLRLQLALAENADAVLAAPSKPGGLQR